MVSLATFSYRDYDRETASTSVYFVEAADDGSNFAALTASVSAVETAIEAVTNAQKYRRKLAVENILYSNAASTAQTSAREVKMRIVYEDSSNGKIGSIEVASPDPASYVLQTNSDRIDLSAAGSASWLALVSALQSNATTRDGNALAVMYIERVGRNL